MSTCFELYQGAFGGQPSECGISGDKVLTTLPSSCSECLKIPESHQQMTITVIRWMENSSVHTVFSYAGLQPEERRWCRGKRCGS